MFFVKSKKCNYYGYLGSSVIKLFHSFTLSLFHLFLALLAFAFIVNGQDAYDSSYVKSFRETRDKDFRDSQLSPLRPDDFPKFEGLKYFPIDKSYCVKVIFTPSADEKLFMMPTSSGRAAKYLKIGVLSFTLDGREFTLSAYRRQLDNPNIKQDKDNLFIPFKDSSNGKETYGAGRYVYLKKPAGNEALLDFNLALNPSCAYGDESFSCTLPPSENFLKIEIKAGEKAYK